MSKELIFTIEQVSREKGIDPAEVVHAIEDAILTASRKQFKNREDLSARFNRDTGQVDIYGNKKVVETISTPDFEIDVENGSRGEAGSGAGRYRGNPAVEPPSRPD